MKEKKQKTKNKVKSFWDSWTFVFPLQYFVLVVVLDWVATDRAEDIVQVSEDEIHRMIELEAYFLAEKRNFQPGFEEEDWATATADVMAKLQGQ